MRRGLPFHAAAVLQAALLAIALQPAHPAAADEPEAVLREAGLRRHGDNVWLLPEEQRLRSRLAELPELREAINVAERELDERREQNDRKWAEARRVIASLNKVLENSSTGTSQRKSLQQQISVLQQNATPPDKLAGRPDVRRQIVAWSQQRTALAIRLLEARREIPELRDAYDRLAERPDVLEALRQLRGQRLGPLKPLGPELRRLPEYDRLAFTAWTPIYLQSGRVRLMAVVNERRPLTLSWSEYPDHGTLLTSGAAQSLGIQPLAGGETRTFDFGQGRKVKGQATVVPSLRLGRWVIPEMPAWILAPEGEDLGSQIDASSLGGYVAQLEPARFRLVLQTRE